MKKYIILLLTGLLLSTSIVSNAAVATLTIAPGVMTNVPFLGGVSSAKITQFVLTSSGTNYGQVSVIDTFTNRFFYTNSAYSNILTYVTNYVSTWTNYYGYTNNVTNSASLVDITNSVAGTTNSFPTNMVVSVGTNATTTVNNPGIVFRDGVWVTNGSGSTLSLVVTYQQ